VVWYHVCCAAHVCVCWVARTVSKLFTDVDVLMLCVDQLITNNFNFFFNIIMRLSICVHLVASCHVMSYHVVSHRYHVLFNFFFIIHFFFFSYFALILLSSCRYFKCSIILIITSYLSHTSSSVNFFFLLASILLQCVAT
jgi:hypothetical protein